VLAIELLEISKVFPGVLANDRVNLQVKSGEIHALLGENGAGKSTLMSILFGLYEPDSGVIKIRGNEVKIRSPNNAAALRIGMVHQHFKLIHNFTVTENIVLGMEPHDKLGNLDLGSAEKRVAELSAAYGLAVDPKAKIENITVGMQQRVEILKILYRNADILIFDEPTSVLTPQEIDELLAIFRRLKSEGKTILFITHKLREIKAAADRCTILRRGKYIDTVDVAQISEAELAEKMIGRAVSFKPEKKHVTAGGGGGGGGGALQATLQTTLQAASQAILKIENLTVIGAKGTPAVSGLSLEVYAGEVVGIAGVDGNGQSELVGAIAGLLPVQSGRVLMKNGNISKDSIRKRNEGGLGLVPEDRHKHGLILDFRLDENFILKSFRRSNYSTSVGFLRFPAIARHAEKLINDFDIRVGNGAATPVKTMSGGNQQKAVIAREVDLSPDVLIIAQPTRGLDVGAIEYIHRRIIEERDKGRAILLVSFELDEILGLCDRIAAISKGRIIGILPAAEADERRIGAMMGGIRA
jgi:simple sugar transport system ATP-binding protein